MNSISATGEEVQALQDHSAKFPIDTVPIIPERDEKLIQERLETYKAIISGNLEAGFTQMPDSVRRDPTLSRAAKMVYEQLLYYMRQKDRCWPSQQTIANDLGTISRRTVIRALKELYERGYIEKQRRGLNQTNVYYINPLAFPRSFADPHRGRGVLIDAHGPEIREQAVNLPRPDCLSNYHGPVSSVNGMCQNGTSGSDKTTHQEATNWHNKHTESKDTQNEEDTDSSKIRASGAGNELGKEEFSLPLQAYSHIERGTIGSKKSGDTGSNVDQQIETSNQSNILDEPARPAHAEAAKEEKSGKKPTFAELALLQGVTPEAVTAMETWLKQHQRPEVVPPLLSGIITRWSGALGNPKGIASNITQAAKIYAYGRLHGLSQQEMEACLSQARDAVRCHEAKTPMAYFFSALRVNVLLALKEVRALPANPLISPLDGYDELVYPDPEPSTEAVVIDAEVSESPAQAVPVTPEPQPVELIQTDDPYAGWTYQDDASKWGERLRDALDPERLFSRYEVLPTPLGKYGVVFRLRKQAPDAYQVLADNKEYLTTTAIREAIGQAEELRGVQRRRKR